MKKIILNLVLAFPILTFGQLNDPAPYCAIDYWGAHYNMINTLNINGTTHSFGPKGSPGTSTPFVYQNSLLFPDFVKGSVSTFTIDFYSIDDGEPIYFGVFIDFNQNDVFDANELIMQTSNTINTALPAFNAPDVTATLDVTIPNNALDGVTRMRVIRGADLTPNDYTYDPSFDMVPCYATQSSYGNYNDFDVKITGTGTATSIKKENISSNYIYPNPSTGRLYIDENIVSVDIYSLDGKRIISTNNKNINLDNCKSGLYIVHLTKTNGEIVISKINLI